MYSLKCNSVPSQKISVPLMYPIFSEYLEMVRILEVMREHFSIADSIVIKYWSINGQSEDLVFERAFLGVFDRDGRGRTSQQSLRNQMSYLLSIVQ